MSSRASGLRPVVPSSCSSESSLSLRSFWDIRADSLVEIAAVDPASVFHTQNCKVNLVFSGLYKYDEKTECMNNNELEPS